MWWPILAFAGIGFEHVVANMFYIPLGCVANACSGAACPFLTAWVFSLNVR
jgi:formate/nitrite transporter FocA (FNT family)